MATPVTNSMRLPLIFEASMATADVISHMFALANEAIQNGIISQNPTHLEEAFNYLTSISPETMQRYIKEGSYYPALSNAMRQGEYQKIYDSLNIMKTHSSFLTSQIRICWAACMVQLHRDSECESFIEKFDPELLNLVADMQRTAVQGHEKMAYENLFAFLVQISNRVSTPESP